MPIFISDQYAIEGDQDLINSLYEGRRKAAAAAEKLVAKLSPIAMAVGEFAPLLAVRAPAKSVMIAAANLEPWNKQPPPEASLQVDDWRAWRAQIERHELEREKRLELARLEARDSYEAAKSAAAALVRRSSAHSAPAPLPRQRAQELAILAKLRELGYDPQALPPPPKGKASPAKAAVAAALSYSKDVMKEAWQRLRDDEKAQAGSGIKYSG